MSVSVCFFSFPKKCRVTHAAACCVISLVFLTEMVIFRRLASTTTTAAGSGGGAPLKGWRKYAHQFRDKPASYMTTFALLHEITAIVPLPIVYYTLDYSGWHIPLVPQEAIAEGNRIMSKLRTRYGYEPLAPDSRIMVNLATSYAVVKVSE